MSEYIWEEPAYRKPRKQSEPLADWFEVVRQLEAFGYTSWRYHSTNPLPRRKIKSHTCFTSAAYYII